MDRTACPQKGSRPVPGTRTTGAQATGASPVTPSSGPLSDAAHPYMGVTRRATGRRHVEYIAMTITTVRPLPASRDSDADSEDLPDGLAEVDQALVTMAS